MWGRPDVAAPPFAKIPVPRPCSWRPCQAQLYVSSGRTTPLGIARSLTNARTTPLKTTRIFLWQIPNERPAATPTCYQRERRTRERTPTSRCGTLCLGARATCGISRGHAVAACSGGGGSGENITRSCGSGVRDGFSAELGWEVPVHRTEKRALATGDNAVADSSESRARIPLALDTRGWSRGGPGQNFLTVVPMGTDGCRSSRCAWGGPKGHCCSLLYRQQRGSGGSVLLVWSVIIYRKRFPSSMREKGEFSTAFRMTVARGACDTLWMNCAATSHKVGATDVWSGTQSLRGM